MPIDYSIFEILSKYERTDSNRRLEQEISNKIRKHAWNSVFELITGSIPEVLNLISLVVFRVPPPSIPQIFFGIFNSWKSHREYKEDIQNIARLARFCGKPIIRRDY